MRRTLLLLGLIAAALVLSGTPAAAQLTANLAVNATVDARYQDPDGDKYSRMTRHSTAIACNRCGERRRGWIQPCNCGIARCWRISPTAPPRMARRCPL